MKRFFIPLAALFSLVAPELTRAAPPIYPGVVPYEQLDTRNFYLGNYPILRIMPFMPKDTPPYLPVDTWSFAVNTNLWTLYAYDPPNTTWHQVLGLGGIAVTINPTDNYSPYRIDATTFGDSMLRYRTSGSDLGAPTAGGGTSVYAGGADGIFNFGYQAGQNGDFTGSLNVFNFGYQAGQNGIWDNVVQSYNIGDGAGSNSEWRPAANNIFNFGDLAGSSAIFKNSSEIYNLGTYAGASQKLTNSYSIYSEGSGAGQQIIATSANTVYNFGEDAGREMTLATVSDLYNIGYRANYQQSFTGKSHMLALGSGAKTTNTGDFVFGDNAYNYWFPGQLQGKLYWGPGTTNYMQRSGEGWIFQTTGTLHPYLRIAGETSGDSGDLEVFNNVIALRPRGTAVGSGIYDSGGDAIYFFGNLFYPTAQTDSGTEGSPWGNMWIDGTAHGLYVSGFADALNHSRLEIYQTDTNTPVIFDSQTSGTAGYSRGFSFRTNGVGLLNLAGDNITGVAGRAILSNPAQYITIGPGELHINESATDDVYFNPGGSISLFVNAAPGDVFGGRRIEAYNNTGALAGTQQPSPSYVWHGHGWSTNLAASRDMYFASVLDVFSGADNPSGNLEFISKYEGGSPVTNLVLSSASGYGGTGSKVLTDNGTYQTASSVITGAISSQLLWTNSPTGGGSLTASSNVIASLPTGLYGSIFNNSEDIFAAGENAGQGQAVLQSTNLYNIGLLSGYGMSANQAWFVLNFGDSAGSSSIINNANDVFNFGLSAGDSESVTNISGSVFNFGELAGTAMSLDKTFDVFNYGWSTGDSMGASNSFSIFNYGEMAGKNGVSILQNSEDIFNYGYESGSAQNLINSTNLFNYGISAGQVQQMRGVSDAYNYGSFPGVMMTGQAEDSSQIYNYGFWAGSSLAGDVADGTFVNFTNVYNYGPEAGMQLKGTNATYVLNYGYRAGEQSTMTGVSDLYNYGSDSGFQSTYDTSATDIYNYGTSAGKGASYTNSFFILNSGNSSGQSMVAQDSSSILNLGSYAGANMVATNSTGIVNIGPYAGNLENVTNSTYIFSYGDRAGNLLIANNSSADIFNYGHDAGKTLSANGASEVFNYGSSAGENSIIRSSYWVFNYGDSAGTDMVLSNVTSAVQDVFNYGVLSGTKMVADNATSLFNYGDSAGESMLATNSAADIFNYGHDAGKSMVADGSTDIYNLGSASGLSMTANGSSLIFNYGDGAGRDAIFDQSGTYDIFNYGEAAGRGAYITNSTELFNFGYNSGKDSAIVKSWSIVNYGESAGASAFVTNSQNIYAYGYQALYQAQLTNSSQIYVFGDAPFSSATITDTDELYVIGNKNGSTSVITNSNNIYLIGLYNLRSPAEVMDSDDLYGFGNSVFDGAIFSGSAYIYGVGDAPWQNAKLTNSWDNFAIGSNPLVSSVLTNSQNIYAYGYQALYQAKLTNSSQIYAFGNNAGASLAGDGYSDIYLFGTAQPTRKTNEFVFGSSNDLYTFPGKDGADFTSSIRVNYIPSNYVTAPFEIVNAGMFTYVDTNVSVYPLIPNGIRRESYGSSYYMNAVFTPTTYYTWDTNFPMNLLEFGGEGFTFHIIPSGDIGVAGAADTRNIFQVRPSAPNSSFTGGASQIVDYYAPMVQFYTGMYAESSATNKNVWCSAASTNVPFMYFRRDGSTIAPMYVFQQFSYDSTGPSFAFDVARGPLSVPTATLANDVGMHLQGRSYDTTMWRPFASMDFVSSGASALSFPGYITLSTTPTSATNPVERVRVLANGNVGIGNTNAVDPLTVTANVGGNGIGLTGNSTTAAGSASIDFLVRTNRAIGSQIYGANGDLSMYVFHGATLAMSLPATLKPAIYGELGIGHGGAVEKLEVDGSILLTGGDIKGGRTNVLTSATGKDFLYVSVPNTNGIGGHVVYTVFCTDGTDVQEISGDVKFAAVAKSTTVTASTADVQAPAVVTGGSTLTAVLAANVATNNTFALGITATTSLTTTNLVVKWRVETPSTFVVNAIP